MRAFRIGRVFGVEIQVDWSWLFIFALVSWNLVALFSRWHPEWPQVEAVAVAGAASLLFFGCVLLHELAHSFVAMSYGLKVRSITLFLFGGVSNIEHEPPSARAELVTAIVGPVTSIVLGVVLTLLVSKTTNPIASPADAVAAMSQLGPFATLLAWLGPINVVIGVFNLIPGFPLDGGRILRATLWSASGDLRWATICASSVGQLTGGLFVVGGIAMTFGLRLPFFGTGFAGGVWLAFIGWFLYAAATQAKARLALDDALAGLTVGQFMRRQGPTAPPDLSVAALVAERIIPEGDGAVPVVGDGAFLGLVSVSDVRALRPERWPTTPVTAVMHRVESLSTTTPEQSLMTAFEQLARQGVGQLPVISDGRLVGMLRRRDLTRWVDLAWRPVGARSDHVATPSSSERPSGAPRL